MKNKSILLLMQLQKESLKKLRPDGTRTPIDLCDTGAALAL